MENHLNVWKSCFSHTNPSNFGRPLRSLLLRYTAKNLQATKFWYALLVSANCFRLYRKLITWSTNAKGLLHHGLDTTSFPGFSPTRPYGMRERGENLGTRLGWTEIYQVHCVIHPLNNWRHNLVPGALFPGFGDEVTGASSLPLLVKMVPSALLSLLYFLKFSFKSYNVCANYDCCTLQ